MLCSPVKTNWFRSRDVWQTESLGGGRTILVWRRFRQIVVFVIRLALVRSCVIFFVAALYTKCEFAFDLLQPFEGFRSVL